MFMGQWLKDARRILRRGTLILLAAAFFLVLGGGGTRGHIDEVFVRRKGRVACGNLAATLAKLKPCTAFGAHLILGETQRPTGTVIATLGACAFQHIFYNTRVVILGCQVRCLERGADYRLCQPL